MVLALLLIQPKLNHAWSGRSKACQARFTNINFQRTASSFQPLDKLDYILKSTKNEQQNQKFFDTFCRYLNINLILSHATCIASQTLNTLHATHALQSGLFAQHIATVASASSLDSNTFAQFLSLVVIKPLAHEISHSSLPFSKTVSPAHVSTNVLSNLTFTRQSIASSCQNEEIHKRKSSSRSLHMSRSSIILGSLLKEGVVTFFGPSTS